MSLLLPQTRTGSVRALSHVRIHDDAYVDLSLGLDDAPGAPVVARVGLRECPEGLAIGERVRVRFVMGVVTGLERA